MTYSFASVLQWAMSENQSQCDNNSTYYIIIKRFMTGIYFKTRRQPHQAKVNLRKFEKKIMVGVSECMVS